MTFVKFGCELESRKKVVKSLRSGRSMDFTMYDGFLEENSCAAVWVATEIGSVFMERHFTELVGLYRL